MTAGLVHIIEDDSNAVDRLLRAAGHGPQHFEHAVSSLRSQRETDALYAEAEKVYVEQGFTVLEARPRWNDFSAIRLDYLRTADDEKVSDDIEKQPGALGGLPHRGLRVLRRRNR